MSNYFFIYNGIKTDISDIFSSLTSTTTAIPTNFYALKNGVYKDLNEIFEPLPSNYTNNFKTRFIISNKQDLSDIFYSIYSIDHLNDKFNYYINSQSDSGTLTYPYNNYLLYIPDGYPTVLIYNTYPFVENTFFSIVFYGFFIPQTTGEYTIQYNNVNDQFVIWTGPPSSNFTTSISNYNLLQTWNSYPPSGTQSLGTFEQNICYPFVFGYQNTNGDGQVQVTMTDPNGDYVTNCFSISSPSYTVNVSSNSFTFNNTTGNIFYYNVIEYTFNS